MFSKIIFTHYDVKSSKIFKIMYLNNKFANHFNKINPAPALSSKVAGKKIHQASFIKI